MYRYYLIVTVLLSVTSSSGQTILNDSGNLVYFQDHSLPKKSAYESLNVESDDSVYRSMVLSRSQFLALYTSKMPASGPYSQETVKIHKKDIYKSIGILEKYYSRLVKSGVLLSIQQNIELTNFYEIAIELFPRDTKNFEDQLKTKRKNPEEVRKLFLTYRSDRIHSAR